MAADISRNDVASQLWLGGGSACPNLRVKDCRVVSKSHDSKLPATRAPSGGFYLMQDLNMKDQTGQISQTKKFTIIFVPAMTLFCILMYFILFSPFISEQESKKNDSNEIQLITPEMRRQLQLHQEAAQKKALTPPTIYNEYPTLTAIPLNFASHSIEDLYQNVRNTLGEKDKYQSTESYEQEKKKRIQSSSLLKSYILFKDHGIFIDYDADTKKLTFDYPNYVSASKSYDLGSYVGSNAFGVEKVVNKYSNDAYSVKFSENGKRKKGFITMEPAIAAKHDRSLEFIYIAQLKSPYIANSSSNNRVCYTPTIDNPEDGCTRWHNLVGKLVGIIVYNSKTGEIIYQEKL
ncbi:MAG: hypothetical protein NDJ24_03060 [Alphaproteobacteria bacterium]|nr:hypothetical protein [Alphaproteobacteria bacterium]